jgi:CHAT domain-containing protein/Flp pilus assembly protein TadD
MHSKVGNQQKALEFFTQALPLHRAARDRNGEATTLINIGAVYYSLGEGQKALESYNQALLLYRSTGDAPDEATTLNNIGVLYEQLGNTPKALEFYNEALAIRQSTDDNDGQANTLNAIGAVYGKSAEKQKAVQFINEALQLYRSAGDRGGEATALGNLGSVYSNLGETTKALDLMNQALALHRATGNRDGEANILNNIGALYSDAGEKRKALEVYSQALPIRRAIGDLHGEALTLVNLMLLWNDVNRPVAIFFGKQAINILQQLRGNVVGLDKEQQKQFLKTNERSYRHLAYMLIGLGRLPEAQQVLNLFKDQQFFDFNNSLDQTPTRVMLTPHESSFAAEYNQAIQRIELAGQKLRSLTGKVDEAKSNQATASELQPTEGEVKVASDQFLAVLKRAETEFAKPDTEIDKVKEVIDTQNLQSALRELTQQTGQKAVAVYTLLDRELEGAGDGVFCALVVTGETINVVTQDIKADAVNKKALQLWGLLQSDSYDPRPLAQELYATVFKPIEALLPKDTNTILWSLDGNLRYLPMGTLYDGKQYLIERFNNVVFTRPDRERLLRPVSARWTGLGLGSSQSHTVEVLGDQVSFNALPGVTEELRLFRQNGSASGTIDGEVFADAKFTKSAMLDALKRRRPLVHISSHFSFRPGDEARSFLLLGDGTAMTLAEMKDYKDLFAGVELLTLSACNTAAQQPGASGREIDGFAELAQRLGAGSVMATLWPVADNSTPWLMRQFYQSRQSGEGLTKAEAFRRAQLALLNGTAQTQPLPAGQKGSSSAFSVVVGDDASRRDATTRAAVVYVSAKDAPAFKRDASKPFAHPYYWAPFILIGNWK